jgi:hypothetical protein
MKHYQDPYQTKARFESKCAKCKETIPKGINIVYVPNDKKAYHLECGQDILDGLRAEKSMDEFGTDIY